MKNTKLIILSTLIFSVVATSCGNDQNSQESATSVESEAQTVQAKSELPEQENEATIIVKANKALEYKFKVDQYEKLTYEWAATSALKYDFHGDPEAKEEYPEGHWESYANGTAAGAKGMVTIPYKGSHGWYWKNESNEDITITLSTKGKYNIVGILQ